MGCSGQISLQDRIVSKPYLVLTGEQLDELDRFRNLSGCILPGSGRVSDELSSRIQKARLTFTNEETEVSL